MAPNGLRRLYLVSRAGHTGALLLGVVLLGCLGWWLLCQASLHSVWTLAATRAAWAAWLVLVIMALATACLLTRQGFISWLRQQEARCKVPELWTCAVETPTDNPFYPALQEQAAAAFRTHQGKLRRPLFARGLAMALLLLGQVMLFPKLMDCLAQDKVQMALGMLDSRIHLVTPSAIARGEDWSVKIVTAQPGPYRLEIQAEHPVLLPFNGRQLLLNKWTESTRYRVHAAWSHTEWRQLENYEPVVWTQLQARITCPEYLEKRPETFDLRQGVITIVEKSRVELFAKPGVEWETKGLPLEWVAAKDDVRVLRPTDGRHHGLWAKLPVTVVPDLPPKIAWIQPTQDATWSKTTAKTTFDWTTSDDFGLREINLTYRQLGSQRENRISVWTGKDSEKHLRQAVSDRDIPWQAGSVYEVVAKARDNAGQWGASEPRYLEMKDEMQVDGMDGKKPDTISLRAAIVALLDLLRDWDKSPRAEKLRYLQNELVSLSATAKSPVLQRQLLDWSGRLNPGAKRLDVESVVQEMVVLQQKAEQTKPKPQSEGQPDEGTGEGSISQRDIERLQALQQAALDPNISPEVRTDLQKQVSTRFSGIKPSLEKQLPQAENLLRDMTQAQKSLELAWDRDLAQRHALQLAQLKSELGLGGQSKQATMSSKQLFEGLRDAANKERGVAPGLLGEMEKAANTDPKTDWNKLQAAAQRWNRALQSELPQLKDKARSQLLAAIDEAEQKGARVGQDGQEKSDQALAEQVEEIAKALSIEQWQKARDLANQAGLPQGFQQQIGKAEKGPPGLRQRAILELFDSLRQHLAEKAQRGRRLELQEFMPIDPKWEPTVDQYFEILNQRKP